MQKGITSLVIVLLGLMVIVLLGSFFLYINRTKLPQTITTQSEASKVLNTSNKKGSPIPSVNSTNRPVQSLEVTNKPSTVPVSTVSQMSIQYASKANWQTYTDEVSGFSIQFNTNPVQPYNSHQSLGLQQQGKSVSVNGCNTPPNGPTAGKEVCLEQYSIEIYNNYNGGSRREWFNQNFNNDPNCQKYYSDLSLANRNAMIITSDCSSWGETSVLVPNGSQMIFFTTKGYSRNDSTGKIALSDWLQGALSTFKFTK